MPFFQWIELDLCLCCKVNIHHLVILAHHSTKCWLLFLLEKPIIPNFWKKGLGPGSWQECQSKTHPHSSWQSFAHFWNTQSKSCNGAWQNWCVYGNDWGKPIYWGVWWLCWREFSWWFLFGGFFNVTSCLLRKSTSLSTLFNLLWQIITIIIRELSTHGIMMDTASL